MRTRLMGMCVAVLLGISAAAAEQKPSGEAKKLAQGQNVFALNLYHVLSGQEGNLFLSPYSIATALEMAWTGAAGNTAKEMAKALCLPGAQDSTATLQAVADLQKFLRGAGGDKFTLTMANALWFEHDFALKATYQEMLQRHFESGVQSVNFSAPDKARSTINAWVEAQTNKKIQDLIPEGILTPDTDLVLTNAVYFKASWEKEFRKQATEIIPFHVTAKQDVAADMMRQTEHFECAAGDGVQVLQMRYAGQEMAMVVLLPDQLDGLAALEQGLTLQKLDGWLDKLEASNVSVTMPLFKTTASFDLNDALQKLGITLAFSSNADFSGMGMLRQTRNRGFYISNVIHKAFVDCNEAGTEAAAATAVAISPSVSEPPKKAPPEFKADHPFLYLIRDLKTRQILFIGRFAKPE